MLFITERKTQQTDLIAHTVLSMVSLFVVASFDEVAKFQEDDFKSFLEDARNKGFMQLQHSKDLDELIEVSRTRKGFLIKASVTEKLAPVEVLTLAPTAPLTASKSGATVATDEVFKPVPGFPNYEMSEKGNLRNVKTGAILDPKGGYKLYRDGEMERMTQKGLLSRCGFN